MGLIVAMAALDAFGVPLLLIALVSLRYRLDHVESVLAEYGIEW